jgi:hypothetical protein
MIAIDDDGAATATTTVSTTRLDGRQGFIAAQHRGEKRTRRRRNPEFKLTRRHDIHVHQCLEVGWGKKQGAHEQDHENMHDPMVHASRTLDLGVPIVILCFPACLDLVLRTAVIAVNAR